MKLAHRTIVGFLIAVGALVLMINNVEFESRHVGRPAELASQIGAGEWGEPKEIVYAGIAAAFFGALVGLVIRFLKGTFLERDKYDE